MEATFATSIVFQALILTVFIVYNLFAAIVTALAIQYRKGHYTYAGGKSVPDNMERPIFGSPYYWHRWFLAPAGWPPHWAWIVAGIFVFASAGTGSGIFFWIVNDYTNSYWLSISSFFVIIPPVLAVGWALVFFCGQSFTGAAVVGFLWFAATGTNLCLTIVYPVYGQMSLPYWTYAWLAFGLGTVAHFLWAAYVFGITCFVAYYNSGRTMERNVASDESMAERTNTMAAHAETAKLILQATMAPMLAAKEDMAATQQLLSQQQQQQPMQQQFAMPTYTSLSMPTGGYGRPV